MTVVNLKKAQLNESLDLNNQDVAEVTKLADQVSKAKSELKLLTIELKQIEKDINIFLDEYYGAVGALFKGDETQVVSPAPANVNYLPGNEEFNENDSLNEIIKKLYKKLSKMCHPDMQGADSISKFFTTVNDAYNKKNLQELLRVEEYLSGEQELESFSPKEKLENLTKIYDEVLSQLKYLKTTKKNLVQSPEYELKRQVLWAKMCGEDLIAKIKSDLYKQLQSTSMEL